MACFVRYSVADALGFGVVMVWFWADLLSLLCWGVEFVWICLFGRAGVLTLLFSWLCC